MGRGRVYAGLFQGENGIFINATLATARPVGAIIRNTGDGELYVSTNDAVPAYTKLTNAAGGSELGVAVNLISVGTATITQYASINAAVAAAAIGDVIIVGAGTYNEPPMNIAGLSVSSIGGPAGTIVVATTPTSPLFTVGTGSFLEGFTLQGANGVGGVGIYFPVGASGAYCSEILFSDCTRGVEVDSSDESSALQSCEHVSGNNDAMIVVNAGAHIFLFDCATTDDITGLNDILRVDGAGAVAHLFVGHYDAANAVNGVTTLNGGVAYLQGCHFHGMTNALHIEASGGTIYALACDVQNTGIYDIWVESAAGAMFLGGTALEREKVFIPVGASVQGTAITRTSGDQGVQIYGEASIGTPNNPGEVAAGEGDSNTRGMTVLSYDGVGVYVNNTVAARSATGSTFALWQGLGANNMAFFGHEDRKFTGIKTLGGGTSIDVTGGSVVWEYWNGAAWTAFSIMAADANAPYSQKAQNAFNITVTADQVRFDWPELEANWQTTLVDGIDGYWVRCRIATGPITTIPVLQQIKLGTNRTEINGDGYIEHFGGGIVQKTWWKGTPANWSVPSGGVNAPNPFNVTISANVTYQQANSEFPSGSDLRRAGMMLTIPEGLDTSQPIQMEISWQTNGASALGVQWDLYVADVQEGDVVGALTQSLSSITQAAPGVANKVTTTTFSVDVSSLVPGDFLAFTLWRKGATDPNPDTAQIYTAQWTGMFWR